MTASDHVSRRVEEIDCGAVAISIYFFFFVVIRDTQGHKPVLQQKQFDFRIKIRMKTMKCRTGPRNIQKPFARLFCVCVLISYVLRLPRAPAGSPLDRSVIRRTVKPIILILSSWWHWRPISAGQLKPRELLPAAPGTRVGRAATRFIALFGFRCCQRRNWSGRTSDARGRRAPAHPDRIGNIFVLYPRVSFLFVIFSVRIFFFYAAAFFRPL